MGGMFGRPGGPGSGPGRSLLLQLSSPQALPPDPMATHDIPPGQLMGKTLPLLVPSGDKSRPERYEKGAEEQMEKPRMRMLIYWGCGEAVGKGQPRVIDTAKMGPAEFGKALASHSISPQYPPAPRSGWVYADWPNKKSSPEIPRDSSLVGEQFVHGNYMPDIRFTIPPKHDFMAPVEFTSVKGGLSESIQFQWKPVPTAIGYFASAMAHNDKAGETIIWSSSEVPDTGFSLMDYVPSGDVRRLIREKVIMSPEVKSCRVPKGIFRDTEGSMMQFIAYGEDMHAGYPPKPRDLIWSVKVRLKSTGMLMLGMSGEQEEQPRKKSRRSGDTEEERSSGPGQKDEDQGESKSPVNSIRGIFGF